MRGGVRHEEEEGERDARNFYLRDATVRAVCFDEFGGPLRVAEVSERTPAADGAVIAVLATGVCRSDWHG